jgi:adenosylcobinamide-GDP ribazoletransferase
MSMGMFSIIPPISARWDETALSLVIPFFPVVGAVIGGLWLGLSALLEFINTPDLLQSAALTLAPLLLSGFIHVDGCMDTSDAIFSRQSLENKRKILKDPHIGAFGAAALAVLLLTSFCAVHTVTLQNRQYLGFLFIPIITRGVVGIGLINLRAISDTGFAAMFKGKARQARSAVIIAECALCVTAAYFLKVLPPVAAAAAAAAAALACAFKSLDGVSGDVCGFALAAGELAGLVAMAAA